MKFSTIEQLGSGNKKWNVAVQNPFMSEHIINEIKERESELIALEKEIDILIERAEDEGADDLGSVLVSLLAVKGKHRRSIRALKAKQNFSMTNQSRFTAHKAGLYRIAVRVNGSTKSTDSLSILVNGSVVGRALAGTANQTVHLHELIPMSVDDHFEIAQNFTGNNLVTPADNSLFVEVVKRKVCRYYTTLGQTNVVKNYNNVLQEEKGLVTRSIDGTQFIATEAGLYRVVVKVVCTGEGATTDYIAIKVDGNIIHRAMVGVVNQQMTINLHEVISLDAGQSFQISQVLTGGNLTTLIDDNTLFVEAVDSRCV